MSSDVTARLDEIADQDEPDWAAYEELACAAIDAARSWTEIAALLESESLQESLLGEADVTAGLARSLVAAALRMPPEERTKALGLLVRSASFDPRRLLRVPYQHTKPELARGLAQCIDLLREALARSGASAQESAPLILCLLASGATDASDVAALLPGVQGKDPNAAALLGAALIAARHGLAADAVVSATRRVLAKLPKKTTAQKQWLTTAAVIAMVVTNTDDEQLRAAAIDVVARPAAIPDSWGIAGWSAATTADWLIFALEYAPSSAPLALGELVAAIAQAPLASPVAAAERAELLTKLAFREPLDARGLLLGRLDDAQRAVLTALATPAFANAHTAIHSLAFWSAQSITAFLQQTGAHYRTLDAKGALEGAPVYPLYLWRAIARGDVELATGVELLCSQLDAGELAELTFSRVERPITKRAMRSPEDWEREHALALALITWLETHDPSYAATLARYAAPGAHEYAFVAEALLRAAERGELVLGPEHDDAMFHGLLSAQAKGTLLALMQKQPRGEQWLARAK